MICRISVLIIVLMNTLELATTNAQQTASYDSALLTVIHDTVVASEAPGIVDQINRGPGTDIESGESLVVLNKKEFEAELQAARMRAIIAELEAANDVNVRFARKSLEVNEKLLNRSERARLAYTKSVSLTDLDRLQLEVQQSMLSEEQAMLQAEIAENQTKLEQQNVEIAKIKLQNRNIRSPHAGRVEQMFVRSGEWVNAGQPIARVVDVSRLRVRAIFDAELFRQIEIGNRASFQYQINDAEFKAEAKVSYVSSIVQKGKFQVWVDVPNPDAELIPGIQGQLIVELNE